MTPTTDTTYIESDDQIYLTLRDLHITPHALQGSIAAYAEAMEWDMIPVHQLGRWRIPTDRAAVVPVRSRKGAGRNGPKTISAVYSTAAACQVQLLLRTSMIEAIRTMLRRRFLHAR